MTTPAATAPRIYALDANAFVQAHRKFYSLDICPGYWKAIDAHHLVGSVGSIDRIRDELARNHDPLWAWVEATLPDAFFPTTDDPAVIRCYGEAMAWVQSQPQFFPQAVAEAATSADTWLFAYAKAKGQVLVTLETFDAHVRRKVPLPNICRAFRVEVVNPFDMLRELQVRFHWPQTP